MSDLMDPRHSKNLRNWLNNQLNRTITATNYFLSKIGSPILKIEFIGKYIAFKFIHTDRTFYFKLHRSMITYHLKEYLSETREIITNPVDLASKKSSLFLKQVLTTKSDMLNVLQIFTDIYRAHIKRIDECNRMMDLAIQAGMTFDEFRRRNEEFINWSN